MILLSYDAENNSSISFLKTEIAKITNFKKNEQKQIEQKQKTEHSLTKINEICRDD